jgi:hypothetical protein
MARVIRAARRRSRPARTGRASTRRTLTICKTKSARSKSTSSRGCPSRVGHGLQNIFAGIVNEFRLSLTSGSSVTTGDVTAATTLYFVPHIGRRITIFDSSGNATTLASAEISIAVPATTSQLYDVFVYSNAGTLTLELLAWTNDTTRATAIVKTGAIDAAGVYTKSGDTTRRYVGSIRTTTSSGQTEDSVTKRYVWNYYNRVERSMRVVEATDSWTYTTATYRQARAAATNQLDFVVGVAEVLVKGQVSAFSANAVNDGSTQVYTQVAIGEDSTSVPDSLCTGIGNAPQTAASILASFGARNAWLQKYSAAGRHTWVWLERSTASNTTTWYGDNGDSTLFQAGIFGWMQG